MRSDGRRNIFGLSEAIRAKAFKSTTPTSNSNSPNQTLNSGASCEKNGVRSRKGVRAHVLPKHV